jgi:hypothetical protein
MSTTAGAGRSGAGNQAMLVAKATNVAAIPSRLRRYAK